MDADRQHASGSGDVGAVRPTSHAPEEWPRSRYAALLPVPRRSDSKFTRGRVLIVGGAPGLTGAACLAAGGALRAGAGYVTVAVPRPSLPVVEVKLTAPVKCALPADDAGELDPEAVAAVMDLAARSDAVVLGCGLGRSERTLSAGREIIAHVQRPLVIDADGLIALGSDLSSLSQRAAPTVITPHAGEAARLLGITPDDVADDRIVAARGLASGAVVAVLKGHRTLVAGNGRLVANPTGGPGLATLGTGDVLAGVIGALLAAGLAPLDAAVVGTYLHGAAGDAASAELTALSCTAEDVVAFLPRAVGDLMGPARPDHDGGTSDE